MDETTLPDLGFDWNLLLNLLQTKGVDFGINLLIALGPKWLYFGAISGSGLFRVLLEDLLDESLPPNQLANRVERFSDKPLSDGLIRHAVKFAFNVDRGSPINLLKVAHDGPHLGRANHLV